MGGFLDKIVLYSLHSDSLRLPSLSGLRLWHVSSHARPQGLHHVVLSRVSVLDTGYR